MTYGIWNVTKNKWVKDFDADPPKGSLIIPDYQNSDEKVAMKALVIVRELCKLRFCCKDDQFELRDYAP